jgi:hypothetical protein
MRSKKVPKVTCAGQPRMKSCLLRRVASPASLERLDVITVDRPSPDMAV